MPPIQTSRCRQTLIDSGSSSRPVITVAPVVVSPDIVSKYASVKDIWGRCRSSGSVANAGSTVHTSVTSRKPSRGSSSRLKRRVATKVITPLPSVMRNAVS